jgi:prolyl-tRNA synthetase
MSAITDNDIIARFEKLSLSKPQIYEHAAVANGAQWKAELEKIGKGDATLTKTVSPHLH